MIKLLGYILLFIIVCSECLNRQFVEGRTEFLGISDTAINDSSIFEGYVYRIDYIGDYPYDAAPFKIWIENSDLDTETDSIGYYLIKTVPGTYTIKCQDGSESWGQLIEGKNNIKIGMNKKARIDFYIGYTIE